MPLKAQKTQKTLHDGEGEGKKKRNYQTFCFYESRTGINQNFFPSSLSNLYISNVPTSLKSPRVFCSNLIDFLIFGTKVLQR